MDKGEKLVGVRGSFNLRLWGVVITLGSCALMYFLSDQNLAATFMVAVYCVTFALATDKIEGDGIMLFASATMIVFLVGLTASGFGSGENTTDKQEMTARLSYAHTVALTLMSGFNLIVAVALRIIKRI